MKRTLVKDNVESFPKEIRDFVTNCDIYNSSCSPEAKVWFADKDNGYFIKNSVKNSLEKEALMTDYLFQNGLSAKTLCYITGKSDWLVTERIKGEDCTFEKYTKNPQKLCEILAESMLLLHSQNAENCPIADRMKDYQSTVLENYQKGVFDPLGFSKSLEGLDRQRYFEYFCANKSKLESNTLIHGDFCLPNIILDDMKFSGFIDVGNGGVGDLHVDVFWCIWTLKFNLKTDRYTDYFLDAYGRDRIDPERLLLIECAEAFG